MPKYEPYVRADGTIGMQRTLDPADADDIGFLHRGLRVVAEDGSSRPMTFEEAEARGVRRIINPDLTKGLVIIPARS